jgi:rubredoxin
MGIFFVFLFFIIANLHPSTGRDTEVTCPLCGATVSYWKQFSYSIFTYGLDLKPIGAARIPQPVPRCENCGFVFIEEYFTDDEINILRSHIIDESIFSGRENLPKYYYLAFELELLGNKNYDEMLYFYVCAVWEYSFNKMAVEYMEKNEVENTRGINFDITIFRFLMQEAVKKINAMSTISEQYNNMQLVKLDFLRRLGLFEESKMLSEDIKNNEIIYQGIVVDIIEYQMELIKNKDIDEHYLEEIKKE